MANPAAKMQEIQRAAEQDVAEIKKIEAGMAICLNANDRVHQGV